MNIYWYQVSYYTQAQCKSMLKTIRSQTYLVMAKTRSRGLTLVRQYLAEDNLIINNSISRIIRTGLIEFNTLGTLCPGAREGILH